MVLENIRFNVSSDDLECIHALHKFSCFGHIDQQNIRWKAFHVVLSGLKKGLITFPSLGKVEAGEKDGGGKRVLAEGESAGKSICWRGTA